MSGNDAQTRVAIMAASEQSHSLLSSLLAEAGLEVVLQEVPGDDFIRRLEKTPADILLVDLSDDTGSEVDIIDTLLEYDSLPVVFNDGSSTDNETNTLWAKKLARKLEQMARNFKPALAKEPVTVLETEPLIVGDQDTGFEEAFELHQDLKSQNTTDQAGLDLLAERNNQVGSEQIYETGFNLELESDAVSGFEEELETEFKSFHNDQPGEETVSLSKQSDAALVVEEKPTYADLPEGAAVNVWVLGASLGGPQAVRQFLIAIKEDLPVAFILAQHIGENHISLLAEQLDRVSKFRVFPGYNGHLIRHHEVILAPAGKNLNVTGDGYIALSDQEENAIYSPCINDVMVAVASRYGNMAGTIVFSGMGDDGAIGCQSVANNGGIVWAQDVDSCVISSMPDQARKTNNVTFSANPRQLADELYKYYME